MQQFNGLQYLAIDIANQVGLDKETWDNRIQWVKDNIDNLESLVPEDPKTKFLYIKAVNTLRNIDKPTGFIMALDATASGVQIMAALGNCRTSAITCNLVNTGKREDIYSSILSQLTHTNITRQQVKDSIIPMLYGSKAAPKKLFGEGTEELKAFNSVVMKTLPIIGEMQALLDSCWGSNNTHHKFTLPDGHVVVLPTMVMEKQRLEIGHTSFTYQWEDVGTSKDTTSILANVIHAVDAYVAREMIRRCNFELAHIHDSFWTHPDNFNVVRQTYVDILAEIAESNLLEDIMGELSNEPVDLIYTDPDLYLDIQKAEYALS